MKIYKDANKIGHATDESPPKFKGQLFVCYEGTTPENVEEVLHSVGYIRDLKELSIQSLTPDWLSSLKLPLQVTGTTCDEEGLNVHSIQYINTDSGLGINGIVFGIACLTAGQISGFGTAFSLLCVMIMGWSFIYRCASLSMDGHVEYHNIKR